jgi:uncharacterized protein (TIGR04141 family)
MNATDDSDDRTAQQLSVYLLKPDVISFEDALKAPDDLAAVPLRDATLDGSLFVDAPPPVPPSWVGLLLEGVTEPLDHLRNQHASAVLLLRVQGRIFAFTFGFGRHLLRRGAIERDFGLRVALNVVDPDKLRSLDSRAFEAVVLATRRQASRGTPAEGLGLDISRELLRAVTGVPLDATSGTRVTGSDSLGMTTKVTFAELPSRAATFLRLRSEERYKARFGYVDRIQQVRDPGLVDELDEYLVSVLGSEPPEGPYLAEPDIVDFRNVSGFRFTGEDRDNLHLELRLDDYLAIAPQPITPPVLKRQEVRLIAADSGVAIDTWPVYDTLVFETERNGTAYVLSEGDWFMVGQQFAQQLDERMQSIRVAALGYPDALPGEWEPAYTARITDGRADRVSLDTDLYRRDQEYGIEICDIFTSDLQLIHLKRHVDAGAMSYLFGQGLVSAELFRSEPEFRRQARSYLAAKNQRLADLVPEGKPERDAFEVVYAILLDDPTRVPRRLPFFARVHLSRIVELLEGRLDFKVAVTGIRQPPQPRARQPRAT